jgi:hypothetical protein
MLLFFCLHCQRDKAKQYFSDFSAFIFRLVLFNFHLSFLAENANQLQSVSLPSEENPDEPDQFPTKSARNSIVRSCCIFLIKSMHSLIVLSLSLSLFYLSLFYLSLSLLSLSLLYLSPYLLSLSLISLFYLSLLSLSFISLVYHSLLSLSFISLFYLSFFSTGTIRRIFMLNVSCK